MEIQEMLDKWGIKCDVKTVLSMWNESHRSYHTLTHLNDLINQINENKSKYTENEYEKLIITSIFHDCVYDPSKEDNEEESAKFFLECSDASNKDIKDINQMILDTKTHKSNTKLSESFNYYDMNIVERDYDNLLKWEEGIHEEFSIYDNETYKKGRLKFSGLLDF